MTRHLAHRWSRWNPPAGQPAGHDAPKAISGRRPTFGAWRRLSGGRSRLTCQLTWAATPFAKPQDRRFTDFCHRPRRCRTGRRGHEGQGGGFSTKTPSRPALLDAIERAVELSCAHHAASQRSQKPAPSSPACHPRETEVGAGWRWAGPTRPLPGNGPSANTPYMCTASTSWIKPTPAASRDLARLDPAPTDRAG